MKYIKYLVCATMICSTNVVQSQGIFSLEEQLRSVQSTGMGGLSNVNEANAFSVYENSSAVAFSNRKFELGLQYSPWAKNLTKDMDRDNLMLNTSGYYSIDDKHKVLAGFSYFAPGGNKMYIFDENGNQTGDEIRSKYYSFNLGYAYRINENWGVSAGISYAHWDDGFNDNSGLIALDFGIIDRVKLNSDNRYIDIAFRMNGWGATIGQDGYKAPGFISIGGMFNSKVIEKHSFRAGTMLEYRCLDESGLRWSLGGEYGFNDMLYARVGYNFVNEYNKFNGFTSFGLGTKLFDRFKLDVTYLMAGKDNSLKNTYMVGASVLF